MTEGEQDDGGSKLGDGWCWGQFMAGSGVCLSRNPNLAKTGGGFGQLKQQLKKECPPVGLASLGREDMLEIMCCVRCGDIPHPDDVLSCEHGHFTCGPCVKVGVGKGKKKRKRDDLGSCCSDLRALDKDGAIVLKDFLSFCQFKCRNWGKGCEEKMTGDMMEQHFENCKFTELVKCRYHGCTKSYAFLDDVLEHYKEAHQASVLTEPGKSIKLPPIDWKKTMTQRLCAILKIEGLYYIFACEVVSGSIFIWMWSMEHGATSGGTGMKTDAWYNLKLKGSPGKVVGKEERALGWFEGRCLVYSVDPEVICKVDGGMVESFKMEVDLFKKLYVNEEVYGGSGGWTVAVLVKSGGGGGPRGNY